MSDSFEFLFLDPTFHIRRYAPARRSLVSAMVRWNSEAVGRGCPSSTYILSS